MKKLMIVLLTASIFTACGGGGKSASKLAKEVCDCFSKNQNITFPNPETWESYDECTRMQVEVWKKFKGNNYKRKLYNEALRDCTNKLKRKPAFSHFK